MSLYRQGDVLIQRVEEMPDIKTAKPKGVRLILVEGEATGHHHSVPVEDVDVMGRDGGATFLRLIKDSVLEHQEHAPIKLTAGTYKVTRQVEYNGQSFRNVKD